MNAEQRINDALLERLGTYVKRAEQSLMAAKNKALRPLGLTVPQYAALHALSFASLSGSQLARVCCVTPQSMASLLSTMESKGLVTRAPAEVHAQVLLATLTPKGKELLDEADARALAVEARLSDVYTEDELALLRELLDRGIRALQEE